VNQEIDTVQILNSIEEAFKIVPIQKTLVKSGKLVEKTNKDKEVIAITNTNVIPMKEKLTKNARFNNWRRIGKRRESPKTNYKRHAKSDETRNGDCRCCGRPRWLF
jgi:hypothetical protein